MRPSYANVVSTLALVVALGAGGAYAADKLPKNSVGAKQLQKNSVTDKKVKDGSLTQADLAPGTVPTVNGTVMGGDLTGAFPNPKVNVGALSGVLKGTGTGLVTMQGNDTYVPVLSRPGIGTVEAKCVTSGALRDLSVRYTNTTGGVVSLVRNTSTEGVTTVATIGDSVSGGDFREYTFGASSTPDYGRSIEIAVMCQQGGLIELMGTTNSVGDGGCRVVGSVTTG